MIRELIMYGTLLNINVPSNNHSREAEAATSIYYYYIYSLNEFVSSLGGVYA